MYKALTCGCEFNKKNEAKSKTVMGEKVYICPKCGYYNAKIKKS